MSLADALSALQAELSQAFVPQLLQHLTSATQQGLPLHRVEEAIWDWLLKVGHRSVGAFLDAHGSGDQGPELTLPDGQQVRRLENRHSRSYHSIFGKFTLERTVYGSREGQALAFVPLDNRLQLPAGTFSYLLQDWDQELAVEQAYGQVNQTIARMLRFQQSVDSLENMTRQMAEDVISFQELLPPPPPAEEGEVLVLTADCKGVVIRGQGTPTVCGGHRPAGTRANQKRMATVGAVYTVDPYVRTADEVVSALFRDPDYRPNARPQPCHKHVWASLPEVEPPTQTSIELVFAWLAGEESLRNPNQNLPTVRLCDGQEALWQACATALPTTPHVHDILDLLHVTPRLWDAGKLLHGEQSSAVEPWVRKRLQQVLEGKVATVLRGLRREGKTRALKGPKKKKLQQLCQYLHKNRERMRYHEYLRAGYPIASGVIEGACRHLIKDRMERAGMHWTLRGAQAMLDLRSIFISGQWQAYQQFHIDLETKHLYPHRELVAGEAYFNMAT